MDTKLILSLVIMSAVVLVCTVALIVIYFRRAADDDPIQVPAGYDAMPLGMYLDVLKAAEGLEPEDAMPAIVARMTGLELSAVLAMPIPQYTELTTRLAWMQGDPKPAKIRKVYNVGQWRLCLSAAKEDLTASQYIDAQTIIADHPEDRLVDMLAVVLIPEGFKYADGYKLDDVKAAILENLSILDAVAIRDFFEERSRRLMLRFLISSGVMTKMLLIRTRDKAKRAQILEILQTIRKTKADLLRDGAGLRRSTMFLSLPVALGRLHLKCL